MGIDLHAVEQARGGEGNGDSIDDADDLVFAGFCVIDATGGGHEIDADFVSDADDGVLGDFAGLEFEHGFVGEGFEGFIDFGFVFEVSGDDDIDVSSHAWVACCADCEAANNEVMSSTLVEDAAKVDESAVLGSRVVSSLSLGYSSSFIIRLLRGYESGIRLLLGIRKEMLFSSFWRMRWSVFWDRVGRAAGGDRRFC